MPPPTPIFEFEHRRSPIHGRGAFTPIELLPGEVIFPTQEHRRGGRNTRYLRRTRYHSSCPRHGRGCSIVFPRTSLGSIANHSADPNCELIHWNHYHIAFRVLRTIPAGEEITIDYGPAYYDPANPILH